eukprot:CAMPEP_0113483002 /NCGR_PEP_ID=MMETSP0014_2-20120614/23209_1 /TAXON_ID=2857 /ORGANISM="Nitzschia sp." /LENGTH=620 /DNA_ID=CAMNT_0000376535 /DNA_START=139 /DNA_END=2001 /DNA_ORIENTATION=- /assembly_acc=CAM_ASM_000159
MTKMSRSDGSRSDKSNINSSIGNCRRRPERLAVLLPSSSSSSSSSWTLILSAMTTTVLLVLSVHHNSIQQHQSNVFVSSYTTTSSSSSAVRVFGGGRRKAAMMTATRTTTALRFSENDFASWYYSGSSNDDPNGHGHDNNGHHHHNNHHHHHLSGQSNGGGDFDGSEDEDDDADHGDWSSSFDEYEVVNSAWDAHEQQQNGHDGNFHREEEEHQKLLVGGSSMEEEHHGHENHDDGYHHHHHHRRSTVLSEASAQQSDRQDRLMDEFIPPAQDYGLHRPQQSRRYTRPSTSQQQHHRQQYRVGVVVEGMNGDLHARGGGGSGGGGGSPWSPIKTADIGTWSSRKNRQQRLRQEQQRLAEEVGNFVDDGRELWSDIRNEGAYNNQVDYYEVLGLTSPIREDGTIDKENAPSMDDIKQAYRKQVKLHHPDANRKQQTRRKDDDQDEEEIPWPLDMDGQNVNDDDSNDDETDPEEKMQLLNEAYSVLSDERQRELYDRRRLHQVNMKHYSDDIRSKVYSNNPQQRKNPLDVMGTRNVGNYHGSSLYNGSSNGGSFGVVGDMMASPLSSARSGGGSSSSSSSSPSMSGDRPVSRSHQQQLNNNNYRGNGNGNGDGRFFLTEDSF